MYLQHVQQTGSIHVFNGLLFIVKFQFIIYLYVERTNSKGYTFYAIKTKGKRVIFYEKGS